MKYVFITGGVVSGLGKGITASSLGRLLINRGLSVTIQKLDPYINVDPGTMNPYEHGEVFVTDDGAETDLDIGHYERFLGRNFSQSNNHTSGSIYNTVISKERAGEYLGKTIQVVPHITDEIIARMKSVAKGNDVVIIEVGGTVGDIEGMAFIEAIRQFRKQLGAKNSVSIHVTLVPYLACSGEIKTKPTQASVREISQMGVFPDIVVCRTYDGVDLDYATRSKIAMFCNLKDAHYVIHNKDCRSIYEVPIILKNQKLDEIVLEELGLVAPSDSLLEWQNMVERMLATREEKTIAIVGKYVAVPDAYISIIEATKHAGLLCETSIKIKLVNSESVEANGAEAEIGNADGIIVPGGFGKTRGIDGKILAVEYARTNRIPFLGICLGLQMAVIEFARNVVGLKGATSTEFDDKTKCPVIDLMEAQKNVVAKGHTMRLGLYNCAISKGTLAHKLYKSTAIKERHRHRYEFNNKYRAQMEKCGMVFSGVNNEMGLCEIVEIPTHPFFIASQFHPEFLSRPYAPHPLFVGLVKALKENKK
jgi:CTP synthase